MSANEWWMVAAGIFFGYPTIAGVVFRAPGKSFEATPVGPGRYSPPRVVRTERFAVIGDPDPTMAPITRSCFSILSTLAMWLDPSA